MIQVFLILSIISGFLMGLGMYLSMRQFFKIKAYKESRKTNNIFIEHNFKGPQYVFDNDFIEYFPITYLMKKIDNTDYNKYDEKLKKLYDQKAKYELWFWIGIITFISFSLINGDFEINW